MSTAAAIMERPSAPHLTVSETWPIEVRARGWHATPRDDRRRLILRALGDDRLTITQLASRIASEHPEFMPFTYPVLYRAVRPMLESGELSCHSEPWRTRTRRFVFRTST